MSGDDPLERTELTFLLGMAFQLLLGEFVKLLETEGYGDLRPVHGLVFQILARGGITSSELAVQLGVTKQAAGQIVAHLEEADYVYRTEHTEGGRRKLVLLTDKAWEHLIVAGRTLHGLETQISEQLGNGQL